MGGPEDAGDLHTVLKSRTKRRMRKMYKMKTIQVMKMMRRTMRKFIQPSRHSLFSLETRVSLGVIIFLE